MHGHAFDVSPSFINYRLFPGIDRSIVPDCLNCTYRSFPGGHKVAPLQNHHRLKEKYRGNDLALSSKQTEQWEIDSKYHFKPTEFPEAHLISLLGYACGTIFPHHSKPFHRHDLPEQIFSDLADDGDKISTVERRSSRLLPYSWWKRMYNDFLQNSSKGVALVSFVSLLWSVLRSKREQHSRIGYHPIGVSQEL